MKGFNSRQIIFILTGPLLAMLIAIPFNPVPANPQIGYMAGIAVWMATWWFSEAVNIAITALIPFLFLPLAGISSTRLVAQQYSDSIIFLFLGGFMIAFAIEKWGLHKRIALKILSFSGSSVSGILMGVMVSAFLISNWISNTATTIMLFSAVLALISQLEKYIDKGKEKFAAAVLLGLAFSATIGGMATPVGTPPNMFFFKEYLKSFPEQHDLNFFKWAAIGFPLALTYLVCCYLVLKFYFLKNVKLNEVKKEFFRNEYSRLGKFSMEEKVISIIFLFCTLLWLTREDIPIGSFEFKGWKNAFKATSMLDDGSVAIAAALLLFLIPSKNKSEMILEWEDAKKIRYDIILMFGSGFALAYGFEKSGLSDWLAGSLTFLKDVPVPVLVIAICTVVTIISEFASNIASIQLCIPILLSLQKELNVHPLILMLPATFAASIGFMLPVATAANTIVFGTKKIHMRDMFRVGIVLDIIGIFLIVIFTIFVLS